MAESNQQPDRVQPSEQRGGTALRDEEAREKGSWAATAGEGIDLSGGDKADVATDGRPDMPPGMEPDREDVAAAAIHQSQADPGDDDAGDQMGANLAAWLSENHSPRARTRHDAFAPREGRRSRSTRDRPVEDGLDGPGNGRGPQPPADVPAGSERENGSRPPAEPGLATIRAPERPHTETDQTNADTDQTLSDADQTLSNSDQTSADCDQVAADRDQAASDLDLGAGVESREHEITRDMRERTTQRREQTGRARLDVANERDAVAQARDLTALARDQAAAARDLAMAQLDAEVQQAGGRADFGIEIVMRAAEHRQRAAECRVRSAEHRVLAAEDRRAAAHDREQAGEERERALADREMFAAELAIPKPDPIDR